VRQRPEGEDSVEGRHPGSRSTLRLLALAIVLVGVLIFAANELLSSGSTPKPSTTTTTTSPGAPVPSSVTVAVLNGTTTQGLASQVSSTLASEGFRKGTVGNAASQDNNSTLVEFTPGNQRAGFEVASDLALTTSQVVPARSATVAAAASAGGGTPTVIVLLGRNYAQQ
jgi:hypothetical protein